MSYNADLPFSDSLRTLEKIDNLVGVDESFRDAVRAVALRIISNQDKYRSIYLVEQFSQYGTGLGDGRQSERHDHIGMSFITGECGQSIRVIMLGKHVTIIDCNRQNAEKITRVWIDLSELYDIVDRGIKKMWFG